MKNCKISIIIPVYNVANYLSECLDSVINSTLKDIEIICVNDGSTDNSLDVLKLYKEKDARIKIINQDNQGVSVARNNGITKSSGEYIFFFDGDDFLDITALEKMYNTAKNKKSDIVFIDWYHYFNNKNKKKVEFYKNINKKEKLVPHNSWSFAFKRELLIKHPDIRYPVGAHPVEDKIFALMLFCVIKNFSYVNEPLLYYRQHSDMITNKIKDEKKEQYFNSIVICFDFLEQFWKNNPRIIKYNYFINIYKIYQKQLYKMNYKSDILLIKIFMFFTKIKFAFKKIIR